MEKGSRILRTLRSLISRSKDLLGDQELAPTTGEASALPDYTANDMQQVSLELADMLGNRFHQIRLDSRSFNEFCNKYKDPRPGIGGEKLLEYFVSLQFLDLSSSDVYMDVAAQNCPFAFFVRDEIGCQVYRQDLYYMDPGIRGEDIGGDATNLPFDDGSLTKLSLHNSFEHFEGDADTQFILEAQRVLQPGGKLCIVPLFLEPEYRIETEAGWIDSRGEKHLWGKGARFSRWYDPPQLNERVLSHCERFDVELFQVQNAQEMDPEGYLRYFLVLTRRGR